ncbi:MAG TPA: nucleotide pyrophosphohydrolase [Anaerolineae bacterium]|nr:nucleotide pyrophosphohydrolase [Anaerolineae bacterium]
MPATDRTTAVFALREQVRAFITARDWDQFHSPKDLAIALSIEAAELLEHFRFRDDAEIAARLATPEFRQDISDELADVLYFVLAISNKLDIDLSTALESKMAVSARRYPVEKARGKNLKYTAYTDND